MPTGTIAIRDGHTGAVTPAASAADTLAAIQAGDDIVVNGQTAILSNSGGAWFINGQPIVSFFLSATGPTVAPPGGPGTPFAPYTGPGTTAPYMPPPMAPGPPNGITQYYESDGRLMVWDASSGRYVAQGGSDTGNMFYLALAALAVYFLFIRK